MTTCQMQTRPSKHPMVKYIIDMLIPEQVVFQNDILFEHGSWPHHRNSPTHICPTPVNIYKNPDFYEVMVFAPGCLKENFSVTVCGEKLIIDYCPANEHNPMHWVRREYSQHGFEPTFLLDDLLKNGDIKLQYEDGVLTFRVKIVSQTAM